MVLCRVSWNVRRPNSSTWGGMEDVIANVFMYMSAFGCFLCVFSIPKAVLVLLVVAFLNNENEIDIT